MANEARPPARSIELRFYRCGFNALNAALHSAAAKGPSAFLNNTHESHKYTWKSTTTEINRISIQYLRGPE